MRCLFFRRISILKNENCNAIVTIFGFFAEQHPFLRNVIDVIGNEINFELSLSIQLQKKKINLRHLLSNKKVAKVVRYKLNLNIVTIGLQFSRLKFHRKIDTSYLMCTTIQRQTISAKRKYDEKG